MILETASKFCEEMNQSNSVLDKKQVLKKYPEIKELLEVVYNPFKQYYVTSDNLKKNLFLSSKAKEEFTDSIFTLLKALNTREITGHTAIATIHNFVAKNPDYKELIYNIIDKDLKCRIGDKIINDVYPGLIPTFEVALANKYSDVQDKINVADGTWFSSHKLDGCRCLCVIDKTGDIKFYSREGKEFNTLDKLREEVATMNLKNVVLDGEICIVDENGNENFQAIMKEIRRKDHTIQNPKYLVFDQVKYEDFFKQESSSKLSERLEYLKRTLARYSGNHIEMLSQTKIESLEHFAELCKEAEDKNWEGLILRKDTSYKGKRSNDLLKVKKMDDAEYEVIGIETGPFRVIENGKEITIDTLSAVKIIHKGNEVSVGSGFSLDQRKEFYANPSLIIGKVITVQYFEETLNQNGTYSLRFPIFKILHGNKRTI